MTEQPVRSRWVALAGMILGVFAVGVDVTVLSVALPTLAEELHASTSQLQWFTSGYALVLAAAMIPLGQVGDRFGRRFTMLGGIALFGASSVACAFATSPTAFIVARLFLGLAGASIIVMALALFTVLFDDTERPRAVGIWAAANFLAFPLGPILGGWLLSNYWWGWVFLMNVPVAIIGFIAVRLLVPPSRAPQRPDLDPIAIVTSSGGLGLLTYGLIEAGERGWSSAITLWSLAGGLAIVALFAVWELRRLGRTGRRPMVDLNLFRSPRFAWGTILGAIGILALVGILFAMPLYFQGVRATSAMGSGVRLLPLMIGLAFGALPADQVAAKAGAKVTIAAGFVIIATGAVLGIGTEVSSSVWFVAAWMAIVGFGMGLGMATAASAALSQLSAETSGVGSAVFQAAQKIGAPFGAAIIGSVISSAYQSKLVLDGLAGAAADTVRSGLFGGIAVAQQAGSQSLLDNVQASFVHGLDVALIVSAAIAVAGIVAALVFMPGREDAPHLQAVSPMGS
jgi:DHA2 family multidrug resistance protein-like MFS transporter